MKKLFRSRWTRLTLALCMSMALLSTAAYAAEDLRAAVHRLR